MPFFWVAFVAPKVMGFEVAADLSAAMASKIRLRYYDARPTFERSLTRFPARAGRLRLRLGFGLGAFGASVAVGKVGRFKD